MPKTEEYVRIETFITPHGDVRVEIGLHHQSFHFSDALDHFFDEDKRTMNGEAKPLYRRIFSIVIEQAAMGVAITSPEYRAWVYRAIERHVL
jgi:hypothetical protein